MLHDGLSHGTKQHHALARTWTIALVWKCATTYPGCALSCGSAPAKQLLARVLQRAQHDVLDACLRPVLVASTSSTNLVLSLQ